jgi:beta-ketoacyl-acyl-carrier-protein synthase II
MTPRGVVVTGMGCVTPAGVGVPATIAALHAGKSVARQLPEALEADIGCKIGAAVVGFPKPWGELKQSPSRLARATQFALASSIEAAEDAGLRGGVPDPVRSGAVIGTGIGDAADHAEQVRVTSKRGLRAVHPLFIPHVMNSAAAAHVGIEFGLRGAGLATGSACASASHAIAVALRLIQAGDLDLCFAGGTEELYSSLLGLAAFDSLRVLSHRNDEPERACRPFDKGRDGLVMGEGAGVLVLESEDHARRRGARVHARIVGAGMTSDATHIVAPAADGDGAVRAMGRALEDAGRRPTDVTHVNAHGTSTPLNDKVECVAIHRLFGAHARKISVAATKSIIGHSMGASGAIATIATVAAVRDGLVPPTANYETPDPECDVDVVAGSTRAAPIGLALVNAFGFGGHCVSIAVARA